MRCVIFQPYYRLVGGAEKNATKVAYELSKHGWEVCIVLPGDGPVKDLALQRNLRVQILKPPKVLNLFGGQFQHFSLFQLFWFALCFLYYNVRVALWFMRTKTDVVIMNTVRAPLIIGLAPKLARIPSILYLRGYVPTTSRWERYVVRWLVWSASHIISVSRESFETFLSRMPVSLQKTALSKLTVLYNWLEPLPIPDIVPAVERSKSMNYVVIGTLSNVCKRKGIHHLVRMAAELRKRGIAFKVRVAGDIQEPFYYEEQLAEIRRLGLGEQFEFCGFVDPQTFLQEIDIFVLASEHEGMPMAVLEALQYGLPVVAFAAEGVREALLDGAVGAVVPVGDWFALTNEVARLVMDSDLRRERSAAALQRSLEFSREVQVPKFIHVIEEVAQGRTPKVL